MKTPVLLRAAAVISAIFTAGHAMGSLKEWSPMGSNPVLQQMTAVHFDAMGVSRSYLDFYMGFGWSLSIAMALQTVLLWQLASMARADAVSVRPMIAAFILATAASGIIAWQLIFPLPALFSVALLLPLIWAYAVARRPA